MATTSQQVAAFVGNSGNHTLLQVDPEAAFVSIYSVLEVLDSLRVRDAALIRDAGLDKDSEIPAIRERFEIFRGRHLALGIAADEIRKLPVVKAANLMGGKPILSALEAARAKYRSLALGLAARCEDPLERKPDFVEREWFRCESISSFLAAFLASFSGSAEEQPEPREESRPVIGTGIACDTGRGESITPMAGALKVLAGLLPSMDLMRLSEDLLDMIESRGISQGWSATD